MKRTSPVWAVLLTACLLAMTAGCSSSNSTTAKNDDDEEVETGYGTQKKGDVTGAISTVNAEDTETDAPPARVADLLKGRVSGVDVTEAPGGGIRVRIRGSQSITGRDDPLYVVDDMPVTPDPGGTLSFLNPRDIESITVLKDASTTAIYGSRGANGVIVIKTKRGKK